MITFTIVKDIISSVNRLLTEWSLSRRKVFSNCPRRFILRYGLNSSSNQHSTRKFGEIAIKDIFIVTLREVFFDWLNDLHSNVVWTEKKLYSSVKFKITINTTDIDRSSRRITQSQRNQLISIGFSRLKGLMKLNLIRKITTGRIREWSCHKRIKKTFFGHLEVYCSPDIVFRVKSKWHLVRLNFQAEHKQPYHDLELSSMLLWSKGNQYLPNLAEKFVLHSIEYRKGKWSSVSFRPEQSTLQEAKQLLEKDVHNMNILQNDFYRIGDVNRLPLAKCKLYCTRCPYRLNCPVEHG